MSYLIGFHASLVENYFVASPRKIFEYRTVFLVNQAVFSE